MEDLIDIFRFLAISQLLLFILLIGRSAYQRQQVAVSILFCASVTGYLLVDWDPLRSHALFYFFLALTFALPFSFWLFSKVLFDDDFRLKAWMAFLLTGLVLLDFGIFFQTNDQLFSLDENWNITLQMLHHALSLLFIILAIIEAAKGRAGDLVVSRFQFRNLFILLSAILIVLTILSELAFPSTDPPLILDLLQKASIFALSIYFAVNGFELKTNYFREVVSTPYKPQVEVDEKMIEHLMQLMEEEKIYRTEGLSIRQLAAKMDVKEYKLRKAINHHLGARNFNEFLNSYRIQDACEILEDPSKQDMTILEIAYAMGYRSLAPFNRGFKQVTGMTPTAWRKAHRQ